jgi:predicted dehydrogenase
MNTRREFLNKIAISACAMPLLPSLSLANIKTYLPDTGATLRVAIMGLGSYASRVAEAMQSCNGATLVGVISGTPSKINTWQRKYKLAAENCYTYDSFDAIKSNNNIDAVYVITPNGLHHDQVIRVAKAGKHVICEKPLAVNATEAQAMVDACAEANVKLLVGYRMHVEANTLEVIRMRKAGEFGKVLFFQGLSGFRIGDPNQWRLDKKLAGGGALMDIGTYAINGARYLVGEEPLWVTEPLKKQKQTRISLKKALMRPSNFN